MPTKTSEHTYFYILDHLGSTSMVLDVDGNISQSVTYIPYGEIFVEERNGAWNSPYLFNSKELDEETGLYYYGARYLNPTSGMWLSTDPLFEKYVGMSPYNYCAGNPVKIIDPTGMEGYEVNNETGEYWWNPDVTAENIAEGFTYIPTEEMLDEVVVTPKKDQKYGELFTGMTDNPLNFGTAENVRYGGDATEHGESGATSLLQVVKNFINGVADLWRTNFGKNDENPISNNSSQNNSAKDNNEVKSDTTLHIYESVRSIRYGDGVFDTKQETDTIIERYVNGKLEKSDTIKGNKPPRF